MLRIIDKKTGKAISLNEQNKRVHTPHSKENVGVDVAKKTSDKKNAKT